MEKAHLDLRILNGSVYPWHRNPSVGRSLLESKVALHVTDSCNYNLLLVQRVNLNLQALFDLRKVYEAFSRHLPC